MMTGRVLRTHFCSLQVHYHRWNLWIQFFQLIMCSLIIGDCDYPGESVWDELEIANVVEEDVDVGGVELENDVPEIGRETNDYLINRT